MAISLASINACMMLRYFVGCSESRLWLSTTKKALTYSTLTWFVLKNMGFYNLYTAARLPHWLLYIHVTLVFVSVNLEQPISRPKIVQLRYTKVFANELLQAYDTGHSVCFVKNVQHCMPEEGPTGLKRCIKLWSCVHSKDWFDYSFATLDI